MSSRRRPSFLLPVFVAATVATCILAVLLASGAFYDLTGGSSLGLVLTIAASAGTFVSVFIAFGVLLFAAPRQVRRPATGSTTRQRSLRR